MILILGGTTEGRNATKVLDEAGSPFYYSTRGAEQQVESAHGTRLTGGMDTENMAAFCRTHSIRLLVDAAHPFAEQLHQTVAEVSEIVNIPVVRYERSYPPAHPSSTYCTDYADAVAQLKTRGITRLLALTGVQTIGKLAGFWKRHTCFFRILDRPSSFRLAEAEGFPAKNLLVYRAGQPIDELINIYQPQAVITKESGESGGFSEKEEACLRAGIPLFIIQRPKLSAQFLVVTGEYGLRKAVERAVPSFYPLRSGFTTGSCATVASKAALLALLHGQYPKEVSFTLPDGETMRMAVARIEPEQGGVTVSVVKDAGDDPDVTHGQIIRSTVCFSPEAGIHFLQGEGVGRVTLPGLDLPIGGPAINRVPREMITRELSALYQGGLDVTISVPNGKELAQRTFNPRLGIEGGISIIGTSGIVRPFSSEAFVQAIRREMEVAVAMQADRVVINSGAKSERYIKALYPELPAQAFIHFGNFIGETLAVAHELHIRRLTLGIMIGKAVKLAAGHLDTHSKKVVMNKDFLCQLAQEAGCSLATLETIRSLTLARELWDGVPEADRARFFRALMEQCRAHCRKVFPNGELALVLIGEQGECHSY